MVGDTADIVDLARSALSSSWTEEYVSWKYFGNPQGRAYGCRADLLGRPVGFYSNLPLRLKLGSQSVAAAQAVDAMVAPEARRRGLFVEMAKQTYGRLDEDGVVLTYGFSNPAAQAGHLKHLSWFLLGTVPSYLKILRPREMAVAGGLRGFRAIVYRAMLSAVRSVRQGGTRPSITYLRVRGIPGFDNRFDGLWEEACRAFPIAVVRDADYLGWRYAQSPLPHYVILVAERQGSLRGCVVLSMRDLERDGTVAIAEILLAPDDKEAGLALLAEAEDRAWKSGAAQLHCWMLPQHSLYTNVLERSGFIYWPIPFFPRALRRAAPFIVRLAPGIELAPDPIDLDNWFITMGDQDYY
jgi:hypothetical protein